MLISISRSRVRVRSSISISRWGWGRWSRFLGRRQRIVVCEAPKFYFLGWWWPRMRMSILFSWSTVTMMAREGKVSNLFFFFFFFSLRVQLQGNVMTRKGDGRERGCDFFDFTMADFLLLWWRWVGDSVVEVNDGGGEIKNRREFILFVDESVFFIKRKNELTYYSMWQVGVVEEWYVHQKWHVSGLFEITIVYGWSFSCN